MKKVYTQLLFCFSFCLSISALPMYGQSTFIDPTFGNGGKVVTDLPNMSVSIRKMVIQPDGKIVAVGNVFSYPYQWIIARYNIDGTLDNSFGSGGIVSITPLPFSNGSSCIALQPDGKIIIGGGSKNSTYDICLLRVNNNGSLDSTFGTNGFVNTDIGPLDICFQIMLLPSGNIIASGNTYNSNSTFYSGKAFLVGYNNNGSMATSFGNNGIATTPFYYNSFTAFHITDLLLRPNGQILAGGYSTDYSVKYELFRFNPSGFLDTTFGNMGKAVINFPGFSNPISLLSDGSILLAGQTDPQTANGKICLIKVKTNGYIDSTFGYQGKVITDIDTAANDLASSSFIQTDGKIIVAGTNSQQSGVNPYSGDVVLLRYTSTGTVDSSFGINGMIRNDFNLQDEAWCSAVQSDGKLIIGGYTSADSSRYNMLLARYNFNVLPLSLLSFTATQQQSTNLLQWKTTNEINVDRFDIQRSANGKDFTTIGNVRAGLNNYYFTDEQPIANTNYYRLKMIDKDGRYSFSPVRMVSVSNDVVFSIYPNPASDKLHVQIISKKKSLAQIEVLTLDGKIISTTNWDINEGTSIKTLSTAALHSGSYLLKITTNNKKIEVMKFEKL